MKEKTMDSFLTLLRGQFRPEDRELITSETDLKTLKEWSSLQTMIIVNEIDKEYNVILGFEDMKNASSVAQLYQIVQSRSN